MVARRCVRGTDLAESRQRPARGGDREFYIVSVQFTRYNKGERQCQRGGSTPQRTVQVLTPTSLASQYIWYLLPLI